MLILYLKLIAASIVGLAIQLVAKNKSLANKTRIANLQYGGLMELIRTDYMTIVGTVLTITLVFLLFGKAIDPSSIQDVDTRIEFAWGWVVLSKRIIFEAVLTLLFSFTGYTGQDLALRIFSVTNRKINAAIDYKTTKADEQDNTTQAPTPK